MTEPLLELKLPRSREEIAALQRDRKRRAVETAKRAPFWRGRLEHVRDDRLPSLDIGHDAGWTVRGACCHDRQERSGEDRRREAGDFTSEAIARRFYRVRCKYRRARTQHTSVGDGKNRQAE